MKVIKKKTYLPKVETLKTERKWYLIDAKNKILGRLATRISMALRGKNKAIYSPHLPCGDAFIIINAKYIKTTGKKLTDKTYQKYSGYPSGRKVVNLKELMAKNPTKAIYYAVKGMMPKNKLSRSILSSSLKIYPESNHDHQAQKPELIDL